MPLCREESAFTSQDPVPPRYRQNKLRWLPQRPCPLLLGTHAYASSHRTPRTTAMAKDIGTVSMNLNHDYLFLLQILEQSSFSSKPAFAGTTQPMRQILVSTHAACQMQLAAAAPKSHVQENVLQREMSGRDQGCE